MSDIMKQGSVFSAADCIYSLDLTLTSSALKQLSQRLVDHTQCLFESIRSVNVCFVYVGYTFKDMGGLSLLPVVKVLCSCSSLNNTTHLSSHEFHPISERREGPF